MIPPTTVFDRTNTQIITEVDIAIDLLFLQNGIRLAPYNTWSKLSPKKQSQSMN